MTRKKITGSIPVKTPKKAPAKRTYKRRSRPAPERATASERQLNQDVINRSASRLLAGHASLPIVTNTMNSLARRASPDPSGYGHTPPEPTLVQPVPATMTRITLAQDDMDAMIDRLYARLEPVLSAPIPQQDKGAEATENYSTHNRDLLNHLFRIRQQDERLGQLIDRLTL